MDGAGDGFAGENQRFVWVNNYGTKLLKESYKCLQYPCFCWGVQWVCPLTVYISILIPRGQSVWEGLGQRPSPRVCSARRPNPRQLTDARRIAPATSDEDRSRGLGSLWMQLPAVGIHCRIAGSSISDRPACGPTDLRRKWGPVVGG